MLVSAFVFNYNKFEFAYVVFIAFQKLKVKTQFLLRIQTIAH